MKFLAIPALAVSLALAGSAGAANIVVDALGNSSSGGAGAVTGLNVTTGQSFTVTVDPNDLWNAGALPRWSNADGLTHNLFATGTDDSGQSAGTQIGQDFGLWTQNGLSAPYGTLVGDIGGVFKVLGTNFSGAAWGTGALTLYYWDSNNVDNSQFITASVNALGVPEPATWALMIGGFGLAGLSLRTRKTVTA
jgi:hypothetical protein